MKLPLLALALLLMFAAVLLSAPRDAVIATHAMPCTDIDGDGTVTMRDHFISQTYFGQDVPPAPSAVDMDSDGIIGLFQDVFQPLYDFGDVTACQDTPAEPDGGTPPLENPPSPTMTFSAAGSGACSGQSDPDYCVFASGTSFTLHVDIDDAPTQGYVSLQSQIAYGPLIYKPPATLDEFVWPDVGVGVRAPAFPTGNEGLITLGASTFYIMPPVSTFEGTLLELTMNCSNVDDYFTLSMPAYTDDNRLGALVLLDTGEIVPAATSATMLVPEVDPGSPIPVADTIDIHCYGPDSTLDTDGDGCTNQRELGTNPELGGNRDVDHFWDIYDVWTHPLSNPAGWERNGTTDLFGDIFAVAQRYGSTGTVPETEEERIAAALTPPADEAGYHIDYDRTSPPLGADVWDMGPPNGTIDLFADIFGVAFQFGHHCP
ncbi:MAG: flexitail domain-containing putative surface protein [Dehalococcoidia bacterium]